MKRCLIGALTVASLLIADLASAQMGMGGMRGMGMGGMGMGGMGGRGMMGHPPEGVSMLRHRHFRMNGIDPHYANARNPLEATPTNWRAGQALYASHCASCHGDNGYGDGPAAQGMNPKPSNLTLIKRMPIASDSYLKWTLAEGGTPINSPMPPFKEALSSDQLWQVMLYLRSL